MSFGDGTPNSYKADYTNTCMLTCVNVWRALSANTTFQSISATNPVDVTFTINDPLSVFSVDTLSGALDFIPPSMVYKSNSITFDIEDGAALVGMGGQGGHG